ncbi:MAG TPA: hypothetical protein VEW28_08555 [Candidatus Kapabacteria bacterium]|nr:hypothetical protein [Candidatus Kapabacteria bacterium]
MNTIFIVIPNGMEQSEESVDKKVLIFVNFTFIKLMSVQATQDSLPNFDTLWNYGKPAETREKFLEILPRAETSNDTNYLAQLLTQIARTYSLENRFTDAHSILDRAEKMLTADLRLTRVRYLLERGRSFNSAGEVSRSLPLFKEAHHLAVEIGEMRYAIDAIHMIAIAESDPKKQVEWNLKGITMTEPDEKLHGWLWALYNNIGESYLKLHDYDNACKYFHLLSEYQIKKNGEADMFTLKDEAKSLRFAGHPERSLAIIQQVFEKLSAEKKDDGYIRQELAEALFALGKIDEAKPHFIKASELLSKDDWFIKNCPDELKRLDAMSK